LRFASASVCISAALNIASISQGNEW
jgi:hypothetical protein